MSTFAMPDDVHLPVITDLSQPDQSLAVAVRGLLGDARDAVQRLTAARLARYASAQRGRHPAPPTTAH
jgi:hypothetical protein